MIADGDEFIVESKGSGQSAVGTVGCDLSEAWSADLLGIDELELVPSETSSLIEDEEDFVWKWGSTKGPSPM